MKRRTFLKLSGLLPLTYYASDAFAKSANSKSVLVLVELNGGNDGLNTVVPYAHPAYYKLRRRLAVDKKSVSTLDDSVGLAPQLKSLMPIWNDGELGVVQGVGYPKPNRSHFRSIEIWDAATDSDSYAPDGWLNDLLDPENRVNSIVLGRDESGPLEGTDPLHFKDPKDPTRLATGLKKISKSGTGTLAHLIETHNEMIDALAIVKTALHEGKGSGVKFEQNPFAQQLDVAARLIASGIDIRVIKVSIGSFDTHANQKGQHERLLQILSDGLATFRKALMKSNRWDDVVIATYSEFGRRVAENGGGGTDHGTAAPHFVMGGRVKGGLYGVHPDLEDLQAGDLKHSVDFRSLYRGLADATFGATPARLKDFKPLRVTS